MDRIKGFVSKDTLKFEANLLYLDEILYIANQSPVEDEAFRQSINVVCSKLGNIFNDILKESISVIGNIREPRANRR